MKLTLRLIAMMLEVEGLPSLSKEEWNMLPEFLDRVFENEKDQES